MPLEQSIVSCGTDSGADLQLDSDIVLESVESLYKDELKPFSRILRKRVSERIASRLHITVTDQAARSLPYVSLRQLEQACEACSQLEIHSECCNDWSVLIPGREGKFVDPNDPVDIYPDDLWEAASQYFRSQGSTPIKLPGGRYCCAQTLASRQLPFLVGFSLGRICHIVQLAITKRKLLGYRNGVVVPYQVSQSMQKETRAEQQTPYTKAQMVIPDLPFPTADVVSSCLKEILSDDLTQPIPLSNVKRLFRSRFNLDLSETMLGHTKLSNLLQDERFSDVCEVKLVNNSYVVLPKAASSNVLQPRLPPGLWDQQGCQCIPQVLTTAALGRKADGSLMTEAEKSDPIQVERALPKRDAVPLEGFFDRADRWKFMLEPVFNVKTTLSSDDDCGLAGSASFTFDNMPGFIPAENLALLALAKVETGSKLSSQPYRSIQWQEDPSLPTLLGGLRTRDIASTEQKAKTRRWGNQGRIQNVKTIHLSPAQQSWRFSKGCGLKQQSQDD